MNLRIDPWVRLLLMALLRGLRKKNKDDVVLEIIDSMIMMLQAAG